METENKMIATTVRIPERLLDAVDSVIRYPKENRSSFARIAFEKEHEFRKRLAIDSLDKSNNKAVNK